MATFENSSHIAEANWESGTLLVKFKNGDMWEYWDVPNGIFQEMQAAPSAGKFFLQNVRGQFEGAKV
jgi:hypothetical protein